MFSVVTPARECSHKSVGLSKAQPVSKKRIWQKDKCAAGEGEVVNRWKVSALSKVRKGRSSNESQPMTLTLACTRDWTRPYNAHQLNRPLSDYGRARDSLPVLRAHLSYSLGPLYSFRDKCVSISSVLIRPSACSLVFTIANVGRNGFLNLTGTV